MGYCLYYFSVSADNNCLYNAASLFLTGNESIALSLRLLTSIELFCHGHFYTSKLKSIVESLDICSNKLALLKSAFHFTSVDHVNQILLCVNKDSIESAFQSEAALNCSHSQYASLVCVMALSSVISTEIESIYSPKCNVNLDKLFSRTFSPRVDSKLGKSMTLLWSTTSDVSNYNKPNHFVLCTDVTTGPPPKKKAKQSVLPFFSVNKALSQSCEKKSKVSDDTAKTMSFPSVETPQHRNTALPLVNESVGKPKTANTAPSLVETPKQRSTILPLANESVSKPKTANTRKRKKECQNRCCSGTLPARGLPVKSPDECNAKDIGLHFDKISAMNDEEKYDLLKNVWRPPPDYDFPRHVEFNRHWRVNKDYFNPSSQEYLPWLTYSAYFDGVFCLPCITFATHIGKSISLKKLYTEPFTRWNGAPSRWSLHNCSQLHKDCASAMQTFNAQMEGKERRIEEIVNDTMRKRISENRKKLIPIIKTVILCGKKNIALRGHRDDAKHIADQSINSGNFQALLDFRVDSGDDVLRQHFETAPKNATYRSKTIQNQIISCCRVYISDEVIAEIKLSKFFSIICDEATDSANKKQLSSIIRFVDAHGQIREEFLEFAHIKDCSAEGVASSIIKTLEEHGLEVKDARGQGYDGCSTMAGAKGGVAAIIKGLNPKALYFWCSGHRLNLVVADTCKIKSVTNMMDSVRKCSQVFEFSSKKTRVAGRTD